MMEHPRNYEHSGFVQFSKYGQYGINLNIFSHDTAIMTACSCNLISQRMEITLGTTID